MKGLAVSNAHFIREAHNDLARYVAGVCLPSCLPDGVTLSYRPADIRGATNALAVKTLEDAAKAQRLMNPPPTKRRKLATPRRKKPVNPDADLNPEEAYHFIGYVTFRGKVWELDGLKSGPVEVGELPQESDPHQSWMDVVRPILRMKMRKYGGGDEETGSIRFNLLAIVKDQFCKVSDQLELLRRERDSLERQLNNVYPDGWEDKVVIFPSLLPKNIADASVCCQVDPALSKSSREAFTTSASLQNPTPQVFAPDFGSLRMARDLQIMEMPKEELSRAWERCIENALSVKTSVEDELEKPLLANVKSLSAAHYILTHSVLFYFRRRISSGRSTTNRSSRSSFGVARGRGSSLLS